MSLVDDPTVTVGDTVAAEDAAAGADTGELAELPIVEPGSYKLAGEHARGGLGRVIKAFDRRLGRTVAVKELLRLAPEARARFVREAKITARLQHPAIVPIYEAGRWPSGEPFYAMKMVSGRPLSEVIRETKTVADRLALLPNVIAVAEAIAYAHREGVIHRDLKPSNVLVGEFGETVVIDWGIAKDLRDTDAPDVDAGPYRAPEDGRTVAGSVLGTPAYMPPEQARGHTVDARADIYALGALVYHMLAGAPPYGDLRDGTTVLQAVIDGPPTDIGRQVPDAPDDLLAITRKAMARDPADRYASAAELAADIRRFQTGQLVSAHRYSLAAMLRKWIARHRAPVAVGAIALVALALGGAFSIRRIIAERETAEHQRETAETRRNELILLQARASLQTDPTESLQWLKEYPLDATDWPTAHAIADEAAKRGYARWVWDGFDGYLTVVDISPDGSKVAVGTSSGDVVLLDSETGEREVIELHEGAIYDLDFSPDGALLATVDDVGVAGIWDTETLSNRNRKLHEAPISFIRFAPDGAAVATAGLDGNSILWTLSSDEVMELNHPAAVYDVAWSSDSSFVVTGCADGLMRSWSAASGEIMRANNLRAGVEAVAVSRSGVAGGIAPEHQVVALSSVASPQMATAVAKAPRLLARGSAAPFYVAQDGGTVTSLSEDGSVLENRSLPLDATSLVASANGTTIAAGLLDGGVWVLNEHTNTEALLRGHRGMILGIAVSRSGDWIASISRDGTARAWPTPPPPGQRLLAIPNSKTLVHSDAEGRFVAMVSTTGGVYYAEGPEWSARLVGTHDKPIHDLRFGATGNRLATIDEGGDVALWDPDGPILQSNIGGPGIAVRYSPAANTIAAADTFGFVCLINVTTGQLTRWQGHSAAARKLRFDGEGTRLATAADTGGVRVWRVPSGELLVDALVPPASNLAFEGDALIVATRSGQVYRVEDSGEVVTLTSEPDRVAPADLATGNAAAFSPASGGIVEIIVPGEATPVREQFFLGEITRVAAAADARAFVTVQGDTSLAFKTNKGESARSIVLPSHPVDMTVLSRAVGVATTDAVGRAWMWSAAAAKQNGTPATREELQRWLHRQVRVVAR